MHFTQYVHEVYGKGWTVGEWSDHSAQYTCPLHARAQRQTGCSASFARRVEDLPYRYATRRQALRAARHLYGERDAFYADMKHAGPEDE